LGYIFASLASATAYGVADLVGGLAGRRMPVLMLSVVANLIAALILSVAAVSSGAFNLDDANIGEALAAGVAMSIAGFLLYKALAIGPMSVAAPITAVTAIVIPVIYGGLRGEALSLMQIAAIITAILAIVLSSDDGKGAIHDAAAASQRGQLIAIAVAAGTAIAGFYILFERLSDVEGLWPLAVARYASLASLVAAFAFVLFAGRMKVPAGAAKNIPMPLFTGAADAAAILFYYEAVRLGPIALVVTLTSLYPVVTVALAVLFLKEKPTLRQWAGAGAALAAILVLANS
jgi:drug/metabolite transporter (DMT)-like permease